MYTTTVPLCLYYTDSCSHGLPSLPVYLSVFRREAVSVSSGVSSFFFFFSFFSIFYYRLRLPSGLITAGFCNLCIAISLAEFLSAYPTLVLTSSLAIVGMHADDPK